jgi:hypothetical protein
MQRLQRPNADGGLVSEPSVGAAPVFGAGARSDAFGEPVSQLATFSNDLAVQAMRSQLSGGQGAASGVAGSTAPAPAGDAGSGGASGLPSADALRRTVDGVSQADDGLLAQALPAPVSRAFDWARKATGDLLDGPDGRARHAPATVSDGVAPTARPSAPVARPAKPSGTLEKIRAFRYSLSTGRAAAPQDKNARATYHAPFPQDNPLLGHGLNNPSGALKGTGADGKWGLTQFDVRGPTLDPANPTRLNVDAQGRYPGGVELPSNVFSPRRQTDQMVRQMHGMLPDDIRRNTAFLNPDRVLQNPEQAIRDMAGKREVVIHGSFMGMGSDKSFGSAGGGIPPGARALHQRQLEALNLTLQLARELGLDVKDVFYAVGDTNVAQAGHQRAALGYIQGGLQQNLNSVLAQNGVAPKQAGIPFGADEVAAIAMARQITARRPMTASMSIEGENKPQKYDAYQQTGALARQSLAAMGVRPVASGGDLNLLVAAQGGTATRGALGKVAGDQLSRTVVVDARKENGALDGSLTPDLGALGYSAWGTFNNAFGQGVAQGVISQDYLRRAAAEAEAKGDPSILTRARQHVRELTTQAVAHDAYTVGFRDGGNQDGSSLQSRVQKRTGVDWNQERYLPPAEVPGFTATVTDHVNGRMRERYGGSAPRVLMLPQFNRTFEMVPVTEGAMGAQTGMLDQTTVKRIAAEQPQLFTPQLRKQLGL